MTLLHSIVVALAAVAPAPMPLAPAAQTLPASDTSALALVGASVRTMLDDRLAPDQTVVIRGGRIVAVGPRVSTPIPAGARRVEVQGRTVIPGLTDAHVHLEGTPEQWLPLFVVHGVTTVFNLQGRPEHVALRERVRRGSWSGPRSTRRARIPTIPRSARPRRRSARSRSTSGSATTWSRFTAT